MAARAAKKEQKQRGMNKPSGESRYAKKSKGRKYDYSHLFRDCPERDRAFKPFLWTREYLARHSGNAE